MYLYVPCACASVDQVRNSCTQNCYIWEYKAIRQDQVSYITHTKLARWSNECDERKYTVQYMRKDVFIQQTLYMWKMLCSANIWWMLVLNQFSSQEREMSHEYYYSIYVCIRIRRIRWMVYMGLTFGLHAMMLPSAVWMYVGWKQRMN